MSIAAPVSGECAFHAGVRAEWACQRCGTFVCRACERRTRPEAPPLWPKCWELRSAAVTEQVATESKKLQVAGLLLGLLSFLHPLVMVASLILNIRGLVKRDGGAYRWMYIAGLVGTGLALLLWIAVIAGLAFFSRY